MKNPYSNIIWDWNGTLFDDVEWCMQVVSAMLLERGLEPLSKKEDYHRVFRFPIIDYYKIAGFDFEKESFEALAKEYMNAYHSNNSGNCMLYSNAEKVLDEIKNRFISQVVLSASQIDNLISQMKIFEINSYFEEILGISNIYAASKIDVGKEYVDRMKNINALLIGDTVHDYEVAMELGAGCLLIANGHQSKRTLEECGVPVLSDIIEVLDYI